MFFTVSVEWHCPEPSTTTLANGSGSRKKSFFTKFFAQSTVRRSLTGPFLRPPGLDMSPAAGEAAVAASERAGLGRRRDAEESPERPGPGPEQPAPRPPGPEGPGCAERRRHEPRRERDAELPPPPTSASSARAAHNKAAAAAGRAASAPRPRRLLSSRPALASPSRCRKAREPTARSLLRRAGARPLPPPPALLSEGTGSWGRRRRHSSAPGGGEEMGAGPPAGRGPMGGAMAGAELWARSPVPGAPEEGRTGLGPQGARAPRPRPSSELHRPGASSVAPGGVC